MSLYFKDHTKVFSKEIYLNKSIEDDKFLLVYGNDLRKLYIIDRDDLQGYNRLNVYLNAYNLQKTEYNDESVRFAYYTNDCIIYPYLHNKSVDEMIQESIVSVVRNNYFIKETKNYKTSSLIAKVETIKDNKNIKRYYMNYYINNIILDRIKFNTREPKLGLVKSVLNRQKYNLLERMSNESLNEIMRSSADYSIQVNSLSNYNDILRDNIKLYEYQKRDVIWMSEIENDVVSNNNKIDYEYSLAYSVLDNQFIMYEDTLLPIYVPINNYNQKATINYKGGNLISEVGLGKTLVMLYYILYNLKGYESKFVEFNENCNYFYKRGKLKGTNCVKSSLSNLYCKQHKNTIFVDKRSTRFVNLDDFNITDYIYTLSGVDYIKTQGTIIVCPNHLCDQWIQEYYNKFNNNKRVLLIVTSDQYDNITFGDLLFADIIVISYNFLLNKRYNSERYTNFASYVNKKTSGKIDVYNMSNQDKHELLNSKIFNSLHIFFWSRVVLDEVHEVKNMIRSNDLQKLIQDLQSTFKWNISATPFAHKTNGYIDIMNYISDYTRVLHYTNEYSTSSLIRLGMESGVIEKTKRLFRRNTKDSIKKEYTGNIIREHIKLLDFTIQERSIYDSYANNSKNNHYNFLIKLCCHPELNSDTKDMIRNCKTFNEIQKCMLDYNKDLMDTELKNIKTCQNEIMEYENEISRFSEPYTEIEYNIISHIRVKISTSKRKYTIHKKSYDDISRTYNYLKQSIENLSGESSCPICLDDIEKNKLTITRCGHKFCWSCITTTFKVRTENTHNKQIKCPSCNTVISHSDLYLYKDSNDSHETNMEEIIDLNKLIEETKSTKIGNIIYYLKNSLENKDKVIIFSQWDEILQRVGDILLKHNIDIVYCNGTVYQKKNAISKFCKDESINVILLSSKNAASGINLTVANKIILLEPIYGSKEYRTDIETQALGRADRIGQNNPIDVIRFIIKDTVEEELIDDNTKQ